VDVLEHDFHVLAREGNVQDGARSFFGKSTVLSSLHIETLDLELVDILSINFNHVHGSILLLRV
jgi:hypothetical protein